MIPKFFKSYELVKWISFERLFIPEPLRMSGFAFFSISTWITGCDASADAQCRGVCPSSSMALLMSKSRGGLRIKSGIGSSSLPKKLSSFSV
ncbi:hypothetical protein OGATHE_004838 [Ogataea polymorpha]|uniref:Uncharacterized protein n=1 Tax=Ogataea polymorpha TaxID=460523 RepID=A0A9P8P164_9ASCO|nr:hypothetical protein OGATHE_004838 [Ogataea polymorpha]